jgi:hypothetical protein
MIVPGSDLGSIVLADPGGNPTALGDLAGSTLVGQLVRYFGCLPCQEWLLNLDRATDTLAAIGARPVAVGGSADHQARWLRGEMSVAMPLLLDPAHQRRQVLGVGDLGGRLLDPRGLISYGRSRAHGFRPQRVTKDTVRAPGMVILDEQLAGGPSAAALAIIRRCRS